MGVELRTDPVIEERIRAMFGSRGRDMPDNNLRQAQVPEGARPIAQQPGTAPGLICPIGDRRRSGHLRRARACPTRCRRWSSGTVLPDLQRRAGVHGGDPQPHAADVGDERVGPGRAAGRRASTSSTQSGQRHHRLPGQRDRGAQGPGHGQGGHRRRGRPRSLADEVDAAAGPPRRRRLQQSTTSRWRRSCSTCCAHAGSRSGCAESVTGGSDRLPPDRRGRRQRRVPRRDRLLRQRGQVRRARRAGGPGRVRRRRRCHGRGRVPGARLRRRPRGHRCGRARVAGGHARGHRVPRAVRRRRAPRRR